MSQADIFDIPESKKKKDRRRRAQLYDSDYAKKWYAANKERLKEKAAKRMRAWRAANPEKERAIQKRWRERNRDYCRQYRLRRSYGLTAEQWESLFSAQDGKCAICSVDRPAQWHVDHCHNKTTVRGILCGHCNLMLGQARDNPDILIRAAEYLRRAQKT